ncbi:MAG: 3-oxoacyl-ACP reductase FabG [Deinococcus sp.]|nr:3-oxoacyl-ACP reductase FabG [Deinococcus sp.]
MARLQGKVALVTGGGRSIGRAISLRLAQEGARVAVNYFAGDPPAKGEAEATCRDVQRAGGEAIPVEADVANRAQVERMVAEVKRRWGPVDILVNNAGIAIFGLFLEVTDDLWERTMATNVTGMFICSQVVAGDMVLRCSGKIINITSTASKVAIPNLPHYCTSKAAAGMLTQAMALDLGKFNINVNAVGPSTTPSKMTEKLLSDPEVRRREEMVNPLGRLGTPEDIAAAVAFLASDDARQINGHTLMVDGGLTIRSPQLD